MINCGIIGWGNTGGQIAALVQEKLGIPAMVLNTSEADVKSIKTDVVKVVFGDGNGSGKNRSEAKEFLKGAITTILGGQTIQNFVKDMQIVFVVSSTGGGTGSGTAPVFTAIMQEASTSTYFIPIGVLPAKSESKSAMENSLEYLKEIYSMEGLTYMLYDNEKYKHLPSHECLKAVNDEVVADIDVLRGTYNKSTPYESMDPADAMTLITTTGRLAVARVENIDERELDDTTIGKKIINAFKRSAHADLQRDKKISRLGVISNLSETINALHDPHISEVQNDFLGTPDEDFPHVYVNTEDAQPNNVYVIASGLSMIDDRIESIKDRIAQIDASHNVKETMSALDTVDVSSLNSWKTKKKKKATDGEIQVADIMAKFMK